MSLRSLTRNYTTIAALAALFLLNLLLRIFYLSYDFVSGDETVRALTATRVLEGARLYSDIVTDKPPGATWFYAAVFALFGKSMDAVHLAAALWNFATATVTFLIGRFAYGSKVGLASAFLFVYFSTNYLSHDMMAANTELLMALPYSAAFLLFLMTRVPLPNGDASKGRARVGLLFSAGTLTGIAALFKQVGAINLVYFTLSLVVGFRRAGLGANGFDTDPRPASRAAGGTSNGRASFRGAALSLGVLTLGFALVMGGLLLWLNQAGTLREFWTYVIDLNVHYMASIPRHRWVELMLERGLGFALFNGSLWALAVWVAVRAARAGRARNREYQADIEASLWALTSLVAVFAGGRFFGHYFIQVLPALSVLGGRGLCELLERVSRGPSRKNVAAAILLSVIFVFGLVRFHHRTAVLAWESITGSETTWSEKWAVTRREEEAEVIAGLLKDAVRPGDWLFVWDFALDIYWETGTRSASRFLAPHYVTGRFTEADAPGVEAEGFIARCRSLLVEDLRARRPKLILDVYGGLETASYPELSEFVRANYRRGPSLGPHPDRPFFAYRLRELE